MTDQWWTFGYVRNQLCNDIIQCLWYIVDALFTQGSPDMGTISSWNTSGRSWSVGDYFLTHYPVMFSVYSGRTAAVLICLHVHHIHMDERLAKQTVHLTWLLSCSFDCFSLQSFMSTIHWAWNHWWNVMHIGLGRLMRNEILHSYFQDSWEYCSAGMLSRDQKNEMGWGRKHSDRLHPYGNPKHDSSSLTFIEVLRHTSWHFFKSTTSVVCLYFLMTLKSQLNCIVISSMWTKKLLGLDFHKCCNWTDWRRLFGFTQNWFWSYYQK